MAGRQARRPGQGRRAAQQGRRERSQRGSRRLGCRAVLRSPPPSPSVPVARQAREHFLAALVETLPPLTDAMRQRLVELVDSATSGREGQERRDALMDFDRQRRDWQEGTAKAWRKAVVPPTATTRVRLEMLNLELIGDDVVENKILSSRLAMAIGEKASWELNDLRLRMQHLEKSEEQSSDDILRPEAIAQLMVEQWNAAGLGRPLWQMVQDAIERQMAEALVPVYKSLNVYLVERGVLPDIEMAKRVRRAAPGRRAPGAAAVEAPTTGQDVQPGQPGESGGWHDAGGGWGGGGAAASG
ncbi:MAG: DUF1631 family protein, partial [Comamonadaceae bacterium]